VRLPPVETWPPMLRELTEMLGDGGVGALKLARAFGGQARHIPLRARPGQVIAQACGLDVARAMSELHGGGVVEIPMIPTATKKVRILQAAGSHNRVAAEIGCTRSHVKKTRRAAERAVTPPLLKIMDGDG